MHIELPPIDEKYLKGKVESGYYSNASEAVRDAVRRMRENDEQRRLDTIRTLIAAGEDQISRGEGVPYTGDLMDNAIEQAVKNSRSQKPVKNEIKPRKT